MKNDTFCNALKAWLIILMTGISLYGTAQDEYCCERDLIFPEFPMPPEDGSLRFNYMIFSMMKS